MNAIFIVCLFIISISLARAQVACVQLTDTAAHNQTRSRNEMNVKCSFVWHTSKPHHLKFSFNIFYRHPIVVHWKLLMLERERKAQTFTTRAFLAYHPFIFDVKIGRLELIRCALAVVVIFFFSCSRVFVRPRALLCVYVYTFEIEANESGNRTENYDIESSNK